MRWPAFLALVCMVAAPAAQPSAPFLPVALDYPADARTAMETLTSDLRVVRESHFNSIRTTIRWADAEPARGQFAFSPLQRVMDAARDSDLRVVVRIDATPPAWLLKSYEDAVRRVAGAQGPAEVCFDHPGARADLWRFVQAAARTVARSPAILTLEIGDSLPAGICSCPYTAKRLEDEGNWHRGQTPSAIARVMVSKDLGDLVARAREAFAAASVDGAPAVVSTVAPMPTVIRELSGSLPGQDDWLSHRLVDRYGAAIDHSSMADGRLSLALDQLSGVSRTPPSGREYGEVYHEGWWAFIPSSASEPDRRFVAWAAMSRGASALIFDEPPHPAVVAAIARNPALFASVRPRRARVALVFDPSSRAATQVLAAVHRALLERQIASELLHVEDVREGSVAPYRVLVWTSSRGIPGGHATETVKAFQSKGGAFVDASGPSMSTARVLELVRSAGVTGDVRVDGPGIDVRLLESDSVQMIIALNYSDVSRRATMTFAPETQEAIWQNMETGAGVHFIAGANGPSYTYWFRPRDALVLMIRKDIR